MKLLSRFLEWYQLHLGNLDVDYGIFDAIERWLEDESFWGDEI